MSDGVILLIGLLAGLAAGLCIAGGWRAAMLKEAETELHRARLGCRNIVAYLSGDE